ncbi:hypothetical protein Ciccas_008372 [Cichlidogyrus casuarinus]|uniref:Phospholipase A2-like central domain-containing protein n=1 Tax=Cichlidogyrus casuarinus TaxID=1844966 RepID=A0ABD2Q1E4_9PLAT
MNQVLWCTWTFCILYFHRAYSITYPFTNWCGQGNTAKDYNDLGYYRDLDMCCRSHDNCKLSVSPGGSLLNYTNTGQYTHSACYCDEQLKICLKNDNKYPFETIATKIITSIYFKWVKNPCLILLPGSHGNHLLQELQFYDYASFKSTDAAKDVFNLD